MKWRTITVPEIILDDGTGLYCLGWYVAWSLGSEMVTLDAEFTANELRDIADFMDEMNAARLQQKT